MTKTLKLFPCLLVAALLLPAVPQASDMIGRKLSRPTIQGPQTGLHLESSEDLTSLVLPSKSDITPYLGAGVTSEPAESNPYHLDPSLEDDTAPPYRLGAGLDCHLSEHTQLDVDYRFHTQELPNLGDVFDIGDTDRPDSHQVSVGLRIAF